MPWIEAEQVIFDQYVPGTPIPDELFACCWSDGDLAQVESVVGEDSLEIYKSLKITANKQNVAQTGIEQPCNLTLCFKMLKDLQQKITLKDVSEKLFPLKKRLKDLFDEKEHTNELKF